MEKVIWNQNKNVLDRSAVLHLGLCSIQAVSRTQPRKTPRKLGNGDSSLSSRLGSLNTITFKGKAKVGCLLLPGTTLLIITDLRVKSQDVEEIEG